VHRVPDLVVQLSQRLFLVEERDNDRDLEAAVALFLIRALIPPLSLLLLLLARALIPGPPVSSPPVLPLLLLLRLGLGLSSRWRGLKRWRGSGKLWRCWRWRRWFRWFLLKILVLICHFCFFLMQNTKFPERIKKDSPGRCR
jgi:hypothetical protein